MRRTTAQRVLVTGIAWVCLGSVNGAQAQQVSDAASGAKSDANVLEEVIVTARRRAESAQTVPVSEQAFNSVQLLESGVSSTSDLQKFVPGVILNGAGLDADTTYTIRGQSKSIVGAGVPSVITYLNEVPLPSIGSVIPAFDVDNMQVLKGPQGTLFGRNTTGGAVLVYTNQPTYRFEGYLQGEFGSYAEHSFQGAINIPLLEDKLAIRAAFDVQRQDGYYNNITTGQDQNNIDSDAFRLSVLLQPIDWLENSTVYDYYWTSNNGTALGPVAPAFVPALTPLVEALWQHNDGYATQSYQPQWNKTQVWGISNTTTANLRWFTVKNIVGVRSVGYRQIQSDIGLVNAPIPLSVPALGLSAGQPGNLVTSAGGRFEKQLSEEFQVSGRAFDGTLNWLGGLFWLYDKPDGPDYAGTDVYRPTPPSPTSTFIVNNFLGGVWPIGSAGDNLYTDRSRAFFGNLSYDLSKWASFLNGITLNGGYRITWDNEGVCSNSRPGILLTSGNSITAPYQTLDQCRADAGGSIGNQPYFASFSGDKSFRSPTYTLGVDYKLNQDVFFYLTHRYGYRAGGLNTPALAPILSPFQSFQPQSVHDFEVGAHYKWRVDEAHGTFNVAAYQGKYDDLQLIAGGISAGTLPGVTAANAPTNTVVIVNAASSTVRGIEFSGAVSAFRAWTLSYGASYMSAYYDSTNFPPVLGAFLNKGPIENAPRWSYNADLAYMLPVDQTYGNVKIDVNYYHIDQEYSGYLNIPGYSLTDLNLEWMNILRQSVDATFFVHNLADKKYIHDTALTDLAFGVFTGSYGPPRELGVRIRYRF